MDTISLVACGVPHIHLSPLAGTLIGLFLLLASPGFWLTLMSGAALYIGLRKARA